MSEPVQRRMNPSYALVYAGIIPAIQTIGRNHGYAIAVHGSMATDLDFVACPWTDDASDAATLVEAIRERMGCLFFDAQCGCDQPSVRPHGRLSWSMFFGQDLTLHVGGPYLDISVMPRQETV